MRRSFETVKHRASSVVLFTFSEIEKITLPAAEQESAEQIGQIVATSRLGRARAANGEGD